MTTLFLSLDEVLFLHAAEEGERFLIERAIVGRAALDEIAGWLERHMRAV